MPVIWIVLACAFCVILAFGLGCVQNNADGDRKATSSTWLTAAAVQGLDKAQLERLLSRIEKGWTPSPKSRNAMCYVSALPPDTVEYVCPTCGERSLYSRHPIAGAASRVQVSPADIKRFRIDSRLAYPSLATAAEEAPIRSEIASWRNAELVHLLNLQLPVMRRTMLDIQKRHIGITLDESLKEFTPRLREMLGLSTQNQNKSLNHPTDTH